MSTLATASTMRAGCIGRPRYRSRSEQSRVLLVIGVSCWGASSFRGLGRQCAGDQTAKVGGFDLGATGQREIVLPPSSFATVLTCPLRRRIPLASNAASSVRAVGPGQPSREPNPPLGEPVPEGMWAKTTKVDLMDFVTATVHLACDVVRAADRTIVGDAKNHLLQARVITACSAKPSRWEMRPKSRSVACKK